MVDKDFAQHEILRYSSMTSISYLYIFFFVIIYLIYNIKASDSMSAKKLV